MIKYIPILLILLIPSISVNARQIRVSDQSGLNLAINDVLTGDTIIILKTNSPYRDLAIEIKASGTINNPIVIMAEFPGQVILTGNSKIRIGGLYIYIMGFKFSNNYAPDALIDNGVIEFRASTSTNDWCYHCMIKNIEFDGHNQSAVYQEKVLKWVRIYGQDNEVVNCSFINKKGIGNCITVERPENVENRALIHHNYFANRIPLLDANNSVLNDQDAIRIGYSGTSLTDASCRIYDNFFYNWNGEAEIISNKSNKNKYFNNTFRKCVGTLTLRHGTHCEVSGNFFFGENISKSGGVRIIDSDHKIYNNYFQDLNTGGSKVVGAINLFKGDADFVIDGILSSYAICEDNLVAYNTIVHCDKGIWIGPDDSGREYEPRDLEIVNNIMVECNEASLVGSAPSGTNIIKGNIKKGGTWWSGFSTGDNLETANQLTSSDGSFQRIINVSEAVGFAVPLAGFTISKDILDGNRDTEPDAGAEEYGSQGTLRPYTLDDVGVTVGALKSVSTGYGMCIPHKPIFKLYPNPASNVISIVYPEGPIKGLTLYELNGKALKQKYNTDNRNHISIDISDLSAGIYLLEVTESSNIRHTKLFIKE